jgi:hypothetical protein
LRELCVPKPGRSRRFVSTHLLGVLELSVVLQLNSDAGWIPEFSALDDALSQVRADRISAR